MDAAIIFHASSLFFFSLFVQAVLFRITRQEHAVWSIVYSWMISLSVSVIFSYMFFVSLFVPLIAGVLFSLAESIYLFGMFATVEAAIRLKILLLIVASGSHGMTRSEIAAVYNREIIIALRLNRLVASGMLLQKGNRYMLSTGHSYMRLRQAMVRCMQLLFPT